MTANELADWLNKKAKVSLTKYSSELLELAADMLRQQAKEIAELRNFISLDEYRKTEWYAYELDNEMKRYKKATEK
jgi:hypothetical protein